jgi:prepilin-type N-terminal cleavage/methylation domain-containing protein
MDRRGFSLIEVMLAVVILSVVLVSLARYTGQFLHTVSTSTVRTVAAEVARERISLVDQDPSYTTLAATWSGGAAGDTTGFPGYPRMRRVTTVSRVTGNTPPRDYTIVTVRVTEPTMEQAIDVTTVVAQP